ncbi:MAG: hypothetical protein V8Q57_04425 [Blautia sp.]
MKAEQISRTVKKYIVTWSYAGLSGDKSRDYYVVSGVDDEIDLRYGLSTATRAYTRGN